MENQLLLFHFLIAYAADITVMVALVFSLRIECKGLTLLDNLALFSTWPCVLSSFSNFFSEILLSLCTYILMSNFSFDEH